MTWLKRSGIRGPELVVTAAQDSYGVTVRLSGNADSRVKDELQAFLLEIHHLAQEQCIDRVAIDLRELEFMNSACFKAFVFWFSELRSMARDQQYHIHFFSNSNIHWQRRSLHALSCFADGLVHIDS